MFKFKKNYKQLGKLATSLSKKKYRCKELSELKEEVDLLVNLYNEMLLYVKPKQHSQMKWIFNSMGYICLLFDNLKDLLVEELHLKDMSCMDEWKYYIETLLIFHSFRVFNYDVLIAPATYYLNNVKFDKIRHSLLLSKMIDNHNDGIYNTYCLIDNTYNKELSKPILKFLEPALNGVSLRISLEEKEAYQDEINKLIFSRFDGDYKPNISIKVNNEVKFKLPKKYPNNTTAYMDLTADNLKKYNTKIIDHDDTVLKLINNPNPVNLYYYLLEVLEGFEHYSSLNKLIYDILDNVPLQLYATHGRVFNLKGDKLIFNVIAKFFMYYFGIGYPKSPVKAMEYLTLNMPELINNSDLTSLVLKHIPYDLHVIINNIPTTTDDFRKKCLNILYLKKTELLKILDMAPSEEQYELLTYIKDNNIYIFNAIFTRYQNAYDMGVEIDRQKELEREKQAELKRQQQLEEEEKQKKIEEEKAKKAEASERLRKSIQEENVTLSEEELLELLGKTDDINAMFKVASYYFDEAAKDYRRYNLAFHYYNIVGDLGNSMGYLNAAIAKNNYNNHIAKDSSEYMENHRLIMSTLEKAARKAGYYFAYAFYAHDYKNPHYTEFIENNYKEFKNDTELSENARYLVESAHYFYNDDYINCLIYFDKVKEFANRALLSMFTNRFFDKLYIKTRDVKPPATPEFVNPFTKEYDEWRMKAAEYSTARQAIAKAKEVINWAASLGDFSSNKYKAYCLYHGIFNFEKDHKKAYDILLKYEQSIGVNEKTYLKILDELKKEFGFKRKK